METLADRIQRDGPVNELDAVGWAIRLAKRIELLHGRGICHGGVTPAAVRIQALGRMSHGVLAYAQPDSQNVSFYSPERVASGGGRSTSDDTWAVAATLYAALTGADPFTGADDDEIRQKVLTGSMAPLAVYDVGDDDLQRVLDEAFTRDIQARTVQISALREALEDWHPDPTSRDLPPLYEDDDEDEDDDEATLMRPAFMPVVGKPQASGEQRHVPQAAATADKAAHGASPATIPRATSTSRTAERLAALRSARTPLLARKPDEPAAVARKQRSPLVPARVAEPVIREAAAAVTPPGADVPTTVRSSVMKVHEDEEDDEATVMRETPVIADERDRGAELQPSGKPVRTDSDSPNEFAERLTPVSPAMVLPAGKAPAEFAKTVAIVEVSEPAAPERTPAPPQGSLVHPVDRSEATLLLPSDGSTDSAVGAADTVPAPAPSDALSSGAGLVQQSVPAAAAAAVEAASPVAMAGAVEVAAPLGPHSPGFGQASPQPHAPLGSAEHAAAPPQVYPQPGSARSEAAPSYGGSSGGPYGASMPQPYGQPAPSAASPGPTPWASAPPRQSISPPAGRLLPAILIALVVVILAAFGAFALLRYRTSGRVFGAVPPGVTAAAFLPIA